MIRAEFKVGDVLDVFGKIAKVTARTPHTVTVACCGIVATYPIAKRFALKNGTGTIRATAAWPQDYATAYLVDSITIFGRTVTAARIVDTDEGKVPRIA